MGNAEGKIEFFQCPEGFRTEPGFIPEFKGLSNSVGSWEGGEEDTELFQSFLLKFEPWWKLPEHHSQFLFQPRGMVEKKGEGFSAILQSFDVGDEAASFNAKRKSFWCPFIPTSKDLFLGEAIKRDVQFDGLKIFCIKFKPLSLRKIRWIKDPIPPMGIIVTAGTDENHLMKIDRTFRLRLRLQNPFGQRATVTLNKE
jgi:hypothetical protein